jgi:hypothetical protein
MVVVILKNKTLEIRLIIKMFIYSAIKIIANKPPLYSILNPEIISDSPSAKSNGARFVSARIVMNHMTDRGPVISVVHVFNFIWVKSIVIIMISVVNIIKDIETS